MTRPLPHPAAETQGPVKYTKQELMETLLETMISNIGYPVGMGMAPHPDHVKKMAEHALKLANAPEE